MLPRMYNYLFLCFINAYIFSRDMILFPHDLTCDEFMKQPKLQEMWVYQLGKTRG